MDAAAAAGSAEGYGEVKRRWGGLRGCCSCAVLGRTRPRHPASFSVPAAQHRRVREAACVARRLSNTASKHAAAAAPSFSSSSTHAAPHAHTGSPSGLLCPAALGTDADAALRTPPRNQRPSTTRCCQDRNRCCVSCDAGDLEAVEREGAAAVTAAAAAAAVEQRSELE
eukprot:365103-Chlamydomonas_euryale.AAC.6